jgi:hypothetical protein
MRNTIIYKKNKLYSPDQLCDLPRECNQYFTQDGLEEWGNDEYEFGTLMCIKSFKIKIEITEIDG